MIHNGSPEKMSRPCLSRCRFKMRPTRMIRPVLFLSTCFRNPACGRRWPGNWGFPPEMNLRCSKPLAASAPARSPSFPLAHLRTKGPGIVNSFQMNSITSSGSFLKNRFLPVKTVSGFHWPAQLTTHIPNRGEQMCRYYGFYSSKSRGMKKKAGEDDVVPALMEPMTITSYVSFMALLSVNN